MAGRLAKHLLLMKDLPSCPALVGEQSAFHLDLNGNSVSSGGICREPTMYSAWLGAEVANKV